MMMNRNRDRNRDRKRDRNRAPLVVVVAADEAAD